MTFAEAKKAIRHILGWKWKPPQESALFAQAAREEAARREDIDAIDRKMVNSLAEAAEVAWNHNRDMTDKINKRTKEQLERRAERQDA